MTSISVLPPWRGVIYRFDKFELHVEGEELRRRGTLVRLSPQPFRVLHLLVSRAGETVTREEIQQVLWGTGTFVDYDQGINAVIRRIRTALGDHAETPRFLHTLPRRGYCFVAPVERLDPTATAEPIESVFPLHLVPEAVPVPIEAEPRSLRAYRFLAMAIVAIALLTMRASHAVRPAVPERNVLRVAVFTPRVGANAPPFDVRMLTTALRSRIARIRPERIRVVEAGAASDLRIDTTVEHATDGVRIDARMSESKTGREVWSETFQRAPDAVKDLPLEVALRASRALSERYLPAARYEPVVRTRVSPQALALYREAREIRTKPPLQRDLDRALALFEQAVALEPRFAEAWSGIGDIWLERATAFTSEPREPHLARARPALQRSLALDPNGAEALNDLGLLLMRFDHAYVAAERAMRRATEIDPYYVDAHINLGLLLAAMGQHEQAVAQFRKLQTLDPNSNVPSLELAFVYLMGHRYGEAAAEYHASLLMLRRPHISHWGLMSSAILAARWDDAAQHLSALLNQPVTLPPHATDRAAAFRNELRRLEPDLLAREKVGQVDSYVLATFYAYLQDSDRSFAALDRAIATHSFNAIYVSIDPRLEFIRNDPRFKGRMERLGFRG